MPTRIPESLLQFIEALVEEVTLEGQAFDAQKKKWLRRYCNQTEGLDYETLESNLNDFFEAMDEWKKLKSKSSQLVVKMLAKDCFLSDGLVDRLLNERTPAPIPTPSQVTEFVDPQLLMHDGKLEEVEMNGRIITPCAWQCAYSFKEGLACVETDDGLYGYIDVLGNCAIPCKWNYAESFSDGLGLVRNENHECFFIDRLGGIVIACKPELDPFIRCGGFREGLAVVEDNNNGLYGFIDKSGHIAIPCKWHDASWFEDGLASVKNDQGLWGCIDKKGDLVIPCKYEDEMVFSEGLAQITDDNNEYYIDMKGNKVFELEYGTGGNTVFKEGLASIWEVGFINKEGDLVIENKWCDYWAGFSEGLAPVDEGYIDHSGRVVIPCNWDEDSWGLEFREGLAPVVKNGKYSVIDHSGNMVVPPIWETGYCFSDGLAAVYLNNKWYYINKQGKVLCKVKTIP